MKFILLLAIILIIPFSSAIILESSPEKDTFSIADDESLSVLGSISISESEVIPLLAIRYAIEKPNGDKVIECFFKPDGSKLPGAFCKNTTIKLIENSASYGFKMGYLYSLTSYSGRNGYSAGKLIYEFNTLSSEIPQGGYNTEMEIILGDLIFPSTKKGSFTLVLESLEPEVKNIEPSDIPINQMVENPPIIEEIEDQENSSPSITGAVIGSRGTSTFIWLFLALFLIGAFISLKILKRRYDENDIAQRVHAYRAESRIKSE